MATDFTIKHGDQLPELEVTLTDSVGAVVDITGATVQFIMNVKGGDNILTQPAVNVDEPGGVVKYVWADGDTDIAGSYTGEFEVLFGDGRAETFPNGKYILIKIFADLGGVE